MGDVSRYLALRCLALWRCLARPGVFIAVVGMLVFAAAGCLWQGMRRPEKTPEPDPVAALILAAGTEGDVRRILSDMAGLAFEEELGAPLEEVPRQADAARAEAMLRGDTARSARLVIVMDDLGEDMNAVRALAQLPFAVTFAVWPRSTHAKKAAETGHAAGREVIIHQPTEPMKYPEVNPGPGALLVALTDAEIRARVRDSLARVPFAVGMNNHMGSRFSRDRRGTAAMVRSLKDHGFFVLDSVTHPGSVLYGEARNAGVPALKRDIFLDADPSRENVLRQLRRAERIALVTGGAIAIGHPLPGTLAALKEWDAQRNVQVELTRLSDILVLP